MDSLPRRHFKLITADPPWPFRGYAPPVEDNRHRRDTERHYKTMSLPEIKAMPVKELAAPDAHLLLWSTWPQLPAALETMEAWGFRYSGSGLIWMKLRRGINVEQLTLIRMIEDELHLGLGHTTRKNTEFALLGRRGNARRKAKNIREVIVAPVREHSRKPEEFYGRAERYCDGPRLELFSREDRPGWTCWGNEIGKFNAVAA